MPTSVATPADIKKLQDQINALQAVDPQLKAAIDALKVLVAKLAADEVTDDADFAALAGVVANHEARIKNLEGVPTPTPTPTPTQTPTPTPTPPGNFTSVARVVASAAGVIELGVPVAAGVLRQARSARVLGVLPNSYEMLAQIDNVSVDRNGGVRFAMLTAIAPASGAFIGAFSGDAETAAPIPPPRPMVTVAADSDTTAGKVWTLDGLWRNGPVVTEAVWSTPLGPNGLRARVFEALYANGASRSTVLLHNNSAATLSYNCTITRGAETRSWLAVQHAPRANTRPERLGDVVAFAHLEPLEGGSTWDYVRATRWIDNYQWTLPSLSMAPIDSTPDAPFAVTSDTNIGYFSRKQGSPGANPDIGSQPEYYLIGLQNFSPDMLRLIGWHADKRLEAPYFARKLDGTFWRMDDGTDYTLPELVGDWPSTANQAWGMSHWGAHFTIPYMLTGRLEYLEGQIVQQMMNWSGADPNGCGRQLARHIIASTWDYTDRGSGYMPQWRTQGWSVRTTVHLEAMAPEDDARLRALTGWDKTMVRAHWQTVQRDLKAKFIDQLTGSGKRFAADGPHGPNPVLGVYKGWMWDMAISSLAVGKDLGVLTPDGEAYYRWNLAPVIRRLNDTTSCIPELLLNGNLSAVLWNSEKGGWGSTDAPTWTSGTGPTLTVADEYKGTAQHVTTGGDSGWHTRTVDNPIGITVDKPGAVDSETVSFALTPGPSGDCFPRSEHWPWYQWTIIACSALADSTFDTNMFATGIVITAITGPNSGTGVVMRKPNQSLWPNGKDALPNPIASVRLGWPHPADGRSAWTYPVDDIAEPDYAWWPAHLCTKGVQHGEPGAAEALQTLRGYLGRNNVQPNLNHDIAVRSQ